MSELIDHIVDVDAIEKEFKALQKYFDSLKGDMSSLVGEIDKIMQSTRGSKTQDDLIKNSKALNDVISGSSKKVEEYTATQKALMATEEKLKQVRSDEYKELVRAQQILNDENNLIKLNTQLQNENLGKLERATLENKKLQIEKNKLLETDADYEKKLREINEAQDKNNEIIKESANQQQKQSINIGNYKSALGGLVEGFKSGEIGAKELGKGVLQVGKQMVIAFITNPILLTIGAIVGVVALLVKAFDRSSESMAKVKQIGGALSGIFGGFMNSLKPLVNFLADTALKAFEGLGKGIEMASNLVSKGLKVFGFDKAAQGLDNYNQKVKDNAKAGQELAKMQSEQTKNERELNRIRFEYLKEQEKFRQVRDDVSKSTAVRIKANDDLGASLLKQADVERKILDQALVIAQERVKIDGETSENLDKVAEAKANIADLEERINGFQSEQLVNAVGIRKEAEDLAKANAQLTTDAQRRLVDAKLAIMIDGEEKQIAISDEAFKRSIEDLKTNSQLTDELQTNLEKAHQMEVQKIRDDAARTRSDKDKEDLDKYIADFEANTAKEVEILSKGYQDKEQALKRDFAKGKMSRKDYEKQLENIQVEAVREANNKTIEILQKELDISELSTEKKTELSDKIRDLQIANENAVLDATIEANEKKLDSDKSRLQSVIDIAGQIASAGMEVFGAISDFEKQKSEERLAAIEEEQKASDALYDKKKSNLDKSVMDDAMKEQAQKKLDEDKAKRDEILAKKVQDEKIRQAKWDKAQALTQAFISTALSTVGMLVNPGGILGFVFAALAAAAGAVNIAKIASQKIPAYEHGIESTPEGFALWGEKRREVAVDPMGVVMYSERPEIRHFEAGTRIYSSVEKFEQSREASNHGSFKFDYDKMAQKMPSPLIKLDGRGIWSIANKEGNRVALLNRRWNIGN